MREKAMGCGCRVAAAAVLGAGTESALCSGAPQRDASALNTTAASLQSERNQLERYGRQQCLWVGASRCSKNRRRCALGRASSSLSGSASPSALALGRGDNCRDGH